MNVILRATLVAGLAIGVLASCAENLQRQTVAQDKARQQYLRYAGDPVDHFSYLVSKSYRRWEVIGDNQIMVFPDYNHAYMLTLQQPCPGLDLADDLRLGQRAGYHMVTKGVDSAYFQGQVCRITEIRPVDYQRMKTDLAQASP